MTPQQTYQDTPIYEPERKAKEELVKAANLYESVHGLYESKLKLKQPITLNIPPPQ